MTWRTGKLGKYLYLYCGYCGQHFNRPVADHLCERCRGNLSYKTGDYLDKEQFIMRKIAPKKVSQEDYDSSMARLEALMRGENPYDGGIVSGRESNPVV